MINWSYFPKTDPIPDILISSIEVFTKNFKKIDSSKNDKTNLRLKSDEVLKILSQDFKDLGYKVEDGKKKNQKISIPVLFGHQGKINQSFEVDGHYEKYKIVLEIEAGRAYTNYQFLKDIFEASVMVDIDYLILAVRNVYIGHRDYKKIVDWLETIYITKRLSLDLKGILLIGY